MIVGDLETPFYQKEEKQKETIGNPKVPIAHTHIKPTTPPEEISNLLDPHLDCSTAHIPKDYAEFLSVFSKEQADVLPRHRKYECEIYLKEDAPVMPDCRIYPLPPHHELALKEYLTGMLEKGFLFPLRPRSHHPFSSPKNLAEGYALASITAHLMIEPWRTRVLYHL
jgi:hypothetical protein